MSLPAVSIIIVNWNTRELTRACVESVIAETTVPFEIILVDNDSSDGSSEALRAAFPQITVIDAGENLGFGRANNLAALEARSDRLLLLNSDTVVLNGAIDALVQFADQHPDARIWGGRTVFEDGALNPASCWGRPTPWSVFCRATGIARCLGNPTWCDSESLAQWSRDSVREVDVVSGCFFLIDRALWRTLDGFDPAFFMYGEELDLCLRAHQHGARPMITPDAEIIHYGGRSDTVREDQTVRQFEAKARVYRRHWSPTVAGLAVRMLDLWALRRLWVDRVLCAVGRGSRERLATWQAVWRRRGEWERAT